MTYNIIDVVKDTLNGTVEYVSKEEKQRRLSICQTCEHLSKLARQCNLCGCFVDVRSKYRDADCHDGRWSNL